MSKKVLKDLLDCFDSTNILNIGEKSSGKTTKLKSVSNASKKKVLKKKKSEQADDPKKAIELYKAFKSSNSKHIPNLKNMKRKFLKHNPDQDVPSTANHNKPKASVFSDEDFKNFM